MDTSYPIPKIIHYCWFGNKPLSTFALRCIESWKRYCPDYEILRWDETNFDISCCDYAREAYAAKKWAFVSDVARLHALTQYGGIYMDTDVELLRPIDAILGYSGVLGFETDNTLQTAFIACRKNCWLTVALLHDYDTLHFLRPDGSYDQTPNVRRFTQKCVEYGLKCNGEYQTVNDLVIFPQDYFSPKDYKTGVVTLSPNSYLIHHFDASWYTQKQISWLQFERKLRSSRWQGLADCIIVRAIKKIHVHGFSEACSMVLKKVRK